MSGWQTPTDGPAPSPTPDISTVIGRIGHDNVFIYDALKPIYTNGNGAEILSYPSESRKGKIEGAKLPGTQVGASARACRQVQITRVGW